MSSMVSYQITGPTWAGSRKIVDTFYYSLIVIAGTYSIYSSVN